MANQISPAWKRAWRDWRCSLNGCSAGQDDPILGLIEIRESLGIYAGRFHRKCWDESGFRREGAEGFDPAYAGESYEEDTW